MFNGKECPDNSLRTTITAERVDDGIQITAVTPKFSSAHEPNAPSGTRFDGLWEFDVSEIFFVGAGEKYTEVELGTAGHFLVLSFDGVRKRVNDFSAHTFSHSWQRTEEGGSISKILIPNECLPDKIERVNGFLIAGGHFLAYSPVPGEKADFHQPHSYPKMHI